MAARPAVETRPCAGWIPGDASELVAVEDRDASARLESDGAETFEVSQSSRGNLTDWRFGEPTQPEQQGRVHQLVELLRRRVDMSEAVTRRGFLQVLGTVGVASAIPTVAVEPARVAADQQPVVTAGAEGAEIGRAHV